MKFQFIKNCPCDGYLMNKSYRKYNVIDNCEIKINKYGKKFIWHHTKYSLEIIPIEYLKRYKH